MESSIDRYELDAVVGRGGFGTVHRAHHRHTGREVAVKLSAVFLDPELRQRCLDEARIAGSLRHPSLIEVLDAGSLPDGRVFIAMPLVVGRTLAQLVSREPLALERVLALAMQLLSALTVVHEAGVVHRDIKPSNILVTHEGTPDERPILIDFGVSKMPRADDQPLTRVGMAMGTPGYMAPEQLDARSVDARADLYSLGAVLYRALAGVPHLPSESLDGWVRAMHLAPRPLLEVAPSIPRHVASAIERALAPDRSARFSSAAEFAAALAGDTRGIGSTPAHTAPSTEPQHRARSRTPLILGAALTVALFFVALTVALAAWFVRGRSEVASSPPTPTPTPTPLHGSAKPPESPEEGPADAHVEPHHARGRVRIARLRCIGQLRCDAVQDLVARALPRIEHCHTGREPLTLRTSTMPFASGEWAEGQTPIESCVIHSLEAPTRELGSGIVTELELEWSAIP